MPVQAMMQSALLLGPYDLANPMIEVSTGEKMCGIDGKSWDDNHHTGPWNGQYTFTVITRPMLAFLSHAISLMDNCTTFYFTNLKLFKRNSHSKVFNIVPHR